MAKDNDGKKLLVIKIYNKTLELISRDASFTVGSKVNLILGSKQQLNMFDKRLNQTQCTGMARLEISICDEAISKYEPHKKPNCTVFYPRVKAAFAKLIDEVLNHDYIVHQTYRKLSVPTLLGLIGQSKVNLLLIGNANSYMVNARTAHPNHYIGTRHAFGLP